MTYWTITNYDLLLHPNKWIWNKGRIIIAILVNTIESFPFMIQDQFFGARYEIKKNQVALIVFPNCCSVIFDTRRVIGSSCRSKTIVSRARARVDEGKFEIGTRRCQMLRSDVNEGDKNESTRPRALRETVFEKTNARSCRFQSEA